MIRSSAIKTIGISMLLTLAMGNYAQSTTVRDKTINFAALKGPSGIGLIRLFDSPPIIEGYRVQMIAEKSADLMAAKVISGEYDLAVLPINMAAKLRASGIDIVLAAIVGNGMVSFLTNDASIGRLSDLRNKDVYVAGQGATPSYLFRYLLKASGLDPDRDIHLLYSMPYPEMAAALAAGRIRYAVLPEPFTTLAIEKNEARDLKSPLDLEALWRSATGQNSYPMTALIVSGKLAATSPSAIKEILAAASSSITWVRAYPEAAGLLVEKKDLGLQAAVAADAIPRSEYVFESATEARSSIEALLGVFLESDPASIGGKLPGDAFYAAF